MIYVFCSRNKLHTYLRAIGFSSIKKREDMDKLLGIVMTPPNNKQLHSVSETEDFVEIFREFCDGMGIRVRGMYDEKGFFHLEHYFPFLKGRYISIREEVSITKKVDNTAYSGMCDDLRLGVSLIFYLQNAIDFIEAYSLNKIKGNVYSVNLSALSIEGKVILPVNKTKKSFEARDQERQTRNRLIAEAKKGNLEAIDSLTIEDIDTYAMVTRRVKNEDVYSIVDTSFFPYGAESDNYAIVGTIMDSRLLVNEYTKEEVYELAIECNELIFNICINKVDLYGEPMIGARFKGIIWLQGKVGFNDNEL